MKKLRQYFLLIFMLVIWGLLTTGCSQEHRFIKKVTFKGTNSIMITFAGPVDESWAKDTGNYAIYEKPDPDILLKITHITLTPDKKSVILSLEDDLNQQQPHILSNKRYPIGGKVPGDGNCYGEKALFWISFSHPDWGNDHRELCVY